MIKSCPTHFADLNEVLHELVTSIQSILEKNFLAAYLLGSFGIGDADIHSDVDWLIAIEHELSDRELSALQAMHGRIFDLPSPWAQHLEGSYFPKDWIKNFDSSRLLYYLDNTARELVRSDHDNSLIVLWVTREYGISLAGPPPTALIDPVPVEDLQREVRMTMRDWGQQISADPSQMDNRWSQPFAVLSYCRMLHTLKTGRVWSKPASAEWARTALDSRWAGLIQRAWAERPNPSMKVRQKANPEDIKSTLEFIRYANDLGW